MAFVKRELASLILFRAWVIVLRYVVRMIFLWHFHWFVCETEYEYSFILHFCFEEVDIVHFASYLEGIMKHELISACVTDIYIVIFVISLKI